MQTPMQGTHWISRTKEAYLPYRRPTSLQPQLHWRPMTPPLGRRHATSGTYTFSNHRKKFSRPTSYRPDRRVGNSLTHSLPTNKLPVEWENARLESQTCIG